MAAVIVSSGRKLSSVHRPVCRELLWLRRCLPLDNSPSVYTTFALFDYCQVKAPLRATGCGGGGGGAPHPAEAKKRGLR